MNTKSKFRERGETTLSVMLGAAIGAIIIGGLMLFYFTANDASTQSVTRSDREADAIKVLNRAGRDISESARVVTATDTEVVVERERASGGTKTKSRIRYAIVEQDGANVLVRQTDSNGDGTYDGDAKVLGRDLVVNRTANVDNESKFTYKTAKGQATTNPAETGLVDITYVAKTKRGTVTLRSSASVDSALGGTTNGESGAPTVAPTAQDITIDVTFGTIANGVPVTSNVQGTPSFTGTGHPTNGVTVAVNPSTGLVSVQVPTSYTGSLNALLPGGTYTVNGSNGSATGTITYRVVPATATTVLPGRTVVCGPNNDTVNIPNVTGVQYRVGGVDVGPGTQTITSGTMNITAVAKYGYVLSGTTSWSPTDTNTACAASVLSYPESVPAYGDTTGVNYIRWVGGALSATRVYGSATAPVVLSGDLNATNCTTTSPCVARVQVPLGTVYRYTVGTVNDDATQFPAQAKANAQGSDRNGDTVAESLGYNTLSLDAQSAVPGTQYDMLQYRLRTSSSTGALTALASSQVAKAATFTSAACNGMTMPGDGTCWQDAGQISGSESLYLPVTYVPADDDYASNAALTPGVVTRSGSPFFASAARTLAASDPARAATEGASAYQAPAPIAATDPVQGGSSATSECWSTDTTPIRLVPNIASSATNRIYNCADGWGDVSYTAWGDNDARNADGSTKAGTAFSRPFCDDLQTDPALGLACYTKVTGGALGAQNGLPSRTGNVQQTKTIRQSGWGRIDTYSLVPCNPGGCAATTATTTMHSWAGPFQYARMSQGPTRRYKNYKVWYAPDCETAAGCNDGDNNDDEAAAFWSGSSGVNGVTGGSYSATVSRIGGAGGSQTFSVTQTDGTPANTGWLDINPATLYRMTTAARPPANATSVVDPATLYRRSTNPSGAYYSTMFSSPLPIGMVQDAPFCTTGSNNGWRYGFAFRLIGMTPGGGVGSNVVTHYARYMWWVGRIGATNTTLPGDIAAARWRTTGYDPTTWTAPGNWTYSSLSTNGTQYWANSTGTYSLDGDYIAGLNGSSTNLITNDTGAAHLRLETYVLPADAGNPDFADLTYGEGEYTNSLAGVSMDTRVKAQKVPATKVGTCNSTDTNNRWKSTAGTFYAWTVVADGNTTTRRADKTLGMATNGYTPIPGYSSTRLWAQGY